MEKNKKTKEKRIDFRHNLSEYFSLLKKHKILFIPLILLVLITESSFILIEYTYKTLINTGAGFASNQITQDYFVKILLILAIVYSGVKILSTILKWISTHLIVRLSTGMLIDLKKDYFNHILRLPHSFHTNHKTGSLISRLTRGSSAIDSLTDTFSFNFALLFIKVIVAGIALAYFNLSISLIIISTIIFFTIYSLWIQKKQEPSKLKWNEKEDIEKGKISDVFTNIDSIKYFGKEDYIKQKYEELAKKSKQSSIKYWDYYKWLDSGQELILAIGTLILLYISIIEFLKGNITIGTVAFIYSVYSEVIGSVFSFVWGIRHFYRGMGDLQELVEYKKEKNETNDEENLKKLKIQNPKIEFQDINFKYGNRKIFQSFNLIISENKKIALVGHSGSGKTSLIKLLYRLYDLESGKILIDNKDIKTYKRNSVRSEMSIVPQECILFDDTIYNNIAFSNPSANKKQVLEAIKFAQLDKIIKNFPKKEKTIVGERGIKLSGGEKQRVSIARAILANKKILVLDEATSALDSQTEHDIQQDLEKLMKGRTSIIVAHRLSTIMNSDEIIVLDKGKIVQRGKHQELINQEGQYKKLWNLQKGGYIK
jgi:ATP-binding cassette subfamily B protein